MTESVLSVFDCLIRLTDERWYHIVNGHPELRNMKADVLATIEKPQRVVAGADTEFLAVAGLGKGWFLVVAFIEGNDGVDCEGFVTTAFKTTKMNTIDRRDQIWP